MAEQMIEDGLQDCEGLAAEHRLLGAEHPAPFKFKFPSLRVLPGIPWRHRHNHRASHRHQPLFW
jgi:hypothetical protein